MKIDLDAVKVEIDLGSIDLEVQCEAFQELLETTPDKDLAKIFKASASPELEELLKEYFMLQFNLVEAPDEEEGEAA